MSSIDEQIKASIARLVDQETAASGTKLAAFESLMMELSSTLADLVGALEARPDSAAAIADALKGLRINPTIAAAAPAVTVKVEPTPIHNHLPAPVVTVQERAAAKGWDVKFKFDGSNTAVPTGMTLTRIN